MSTATPLYLVTLLCLYWTVPTLQTVELRLTNSAIRYSDLEFDFICQNDKPIEEQTVLLYANRTMLYNSTKENIGYHQDKSLRVRFDNFRNHLKTAFCVIGDEHSHPRNIPYLEVVQFKRIPVDEYNTDLQCVVDVKHGHPIQYKVKFVYKHQVFAYYTTSTFKNSTKFSASEEFDSSLNVEKKQYDGKKYTIRLIHKVNFDASKLHCALQYKAVEEKSMDASNDLSKLYEE